jgi:hypothetical protein
MERLIGMLAQLMPLVLNPVKASLLIKGSLFDYYLKGLHQQEIHFTGCRGCNISYYNSRGGLVY